MPQRERSIARFDFAGRVAKFVEIPSADHHFRYRLLAVMSGPPRDATVLAVEVLGAVILAEKEIVFRPSERVLQFAEINVVSHRRTPHRIDDQESIRRRRIPPRSRINVDMRAAAESGLETAYARPMHAVKAPSVHAASGLPRRERT